MIVEVLFVEEQGDDCRCLSGEMKRKDGLLRVDREVYESLEGTESEGQAQWIHIRLVS